VLGLPAGKACRLHHATNRRLAEAIAPRHSGLGLATIQPPQGLLAIVRQQLLRSANAGTARSSGSQCGLDALAMLARAVALLMFVVATSAKGDPISLGIAPAPGLGHEVTVLQAFLRPAGNAELQSHVRFPTPVVHATKIGLQRPRVIHC
jgi:hypothetical protein